MGLLEDGQVDPSGRGFIAAIVRFRTGRYDYMTLHHYLVRQSMGLLQDAARTGSNAHVYALLKALDVIYGYVYPFVLERRDVGVGVRWGVPWAPSRQQTRCVATAMPPGSSQWGERA